LLDRHPAIWATVGDLDRIVVRAWAELLGGDGPLGVEAVRRKAEAFRAELEGEAPTAVEKALIAQVVSTWLELSHAQLAAAEPRRATVGQAGCPLKRMESVQRRPLQAIRTLTTLRALLPQGLLPINHLRLHDPEKKLA